MNLVSALARIAADYRARRRRMNTYLEVSALPREIQKDIGWPDAFARPDRARRPVSGRR